MADLRYNPQALNDSLFKSTPWRPNMGGAIALVAAVGLIVLVVWGLFRLVRFIANSVK